MIRQLGSCLQIAQDLGDRARVPDRDDLEAHQTPDRLGWIRVCLLEERSTDLADRRAHLAHDLLGQIVRDPRQVIGVERLGDLDEAVVRCLANQPRPDRPIDLDDGLRGLPWVECGPRPQPVVRLQPFEDKP